MEILLLIIFSYNVISFTKLNSAMMTRSSTNSHLGLQGPKIDSIVRMCLNVHCRVKIMCTVLRIVFLRFSTIRLEDKYQYNS